MRIQGWQVEGFGVFHDFLVNDLGPGLVVFHGPNEAGKSTLLAFLRSVLFGFPDRRASHPQYLPLHGGRHGGSVFLAADDGVYRLERINGRRSAPMVVRPDASEGGATDLQRLLAGADQTLFRTVFAFSLFELTEMESLSSEGIRARIFSAGIAGAGRSSREVIEALDREAAELLTPRGGSIRQLITNVQDLRGQIERARDLAESYPILFQREEAALVNVDRMKSVAAECETRTRRLEKVIALWPIESQLQHCRTELQGLRDITRFPADPEVRLAAALDARDRAVADADATRLQLSRLEASRKLIKLDDTLARVRTEVASLARELELQRERLRQLTESSVALAASDQAVVHALRDLGPGWDEIRLASFDISLPAVEEVRQWQGRLRDRQEDSARALTELNEREERDGEIEERLHRLMEEVRQPSTTATAARLQALGQELTSIDQMVRMGTLSPPKILDVQTFDATVELVQRSERQLDRLDGLEREASRDRDEIVVDTSLDLVHPKINQVHDHVGSQRERIRQFDELARAQAESQAAVENAIRELGTGWDEETISVFPVNLTVSQRVRELSDASDAARNATERARHDLDTVAQGRSGRQKDLDRLSRALQGPEPPNREALTTESAAIRRLRVHLAELSDARSQIRAEEQLRTDRAHTVAQAVLQASLPTWLTPAALVLALAAFVAALWRLYAGDTISALLLAFIAIAIALSILVLRRRDAAVAVGSIGKARDLRTSLDEIERHLADLRNRSAELQKRVAADALVLGLSDSRSLVDLEDRNETWQRHNDERRLWDELSREQERLNDELESWRESETTRQQALDECLTREDATRHAWAAWTSEIGLSPHLSPADTLDLLQRVRLAQNRIDVHKTASERLGALQPQMANWEEEARGVLALLKGGGDRLISGVELVEAIVELGRRCSDDRDKRRDHSRLTRMAEQRAREIAELEKRLRADRACAIDTLGAAASRLLSEWQGAATDRADLNARLTERSASLRIAEEAWAAWKRDRRVDVGLSSDGVIDFFGQIRRTRDAVDQRDAIRLGAKKADDAASEWEDRARRAALSGEGSAADLRSSREEWLDVVRDLDRKCSEDAEARRRASGLDLEIEQASTKDIETHQRLEAALQSLATLLAEADASDEEDFRRRLEVFRKRKNLHQTLVDLEGRIEASLGLGLDAADIRAQLATGFIGEWHVALQGADQEWKGSQANYEAAIRDHQDLSNERRQLEEAAQIASLELEYQGIVEELNNAVERWRVLRVARALIDETLRDFERTRQPEVLSTASEIFGRVTGGRYPRIVQDQGSENVSLITKLGARRHVAQLSRGTSEQLYLSIRLGLARQFGRRASVLPLVMDDVLVNFDEARAREMAVELLRFSAENQILLFTCHTPTRDLFTELEPETQVISLAAQESTLGAAHDPEADFAEDDANHIQPTLFVPEELESAIIAALGEGSLGISELAARVGCGIDSLRGPLNQLREAGRVELRGQKRGARWCLASSVST